MCGKSIVVWALMTRSGEQESWCSLLATDATPSSSPLLWAASSAVEVVAGRRKHMEGDSGVGHNTMLYEALQHHYERPSLVLVVQKVEGENMKHHLIGSQPYFFTT